MPKRASGLCIVLSAAALAAQDREPPQDPTPVIRAWVDSDHGDAAMLERTTGTVLDAGKVGMRALGAALKATGPDDRDRRIGVESLLMKVVVGALERGVDSGMRYAGQYDVLRELQPYAGRALLVLVADTPDWFPDDMRPLAVPALRDVFPSGPDREATAQLRAIALDEDFEGQALREGLQLALAQWGQRDLVQERIDELTKNAGDASDTDELFFVRGLAQLHYDLRDYATAAGHWQRFATGMRALGAEVTALDLYNAACSASRAARLDDALTFLDECAGRIAAGRVDSTADITREMFETDPDLKLARVGADFPAIVTKAFGKPPPPPPLPPTKDGGKREAPRP